MGRERVTRVVVDARAVHPGMAGIGRYAANLVLSLDRTPSRFHIDALVGPAGAAILGALNRVEFVVVEAAGEAWNSLALPDLLQGVGADLFHSPLFVLPSIRPCPCIATVHDVVPRARPDLAPDSFRDFFEAHAPRALRNAASIVTVSEFSKLDIERHFTFARGKIRAIPQAVSPHLRRASADDVVRERARHRLPECYVLFVGAIDRRKGVLELLEAWKLVAESQSGAVLAIAGAPSGTGLDLMKEVERLELAPSVRMLGHVSDVALPALYSGAAVFVFPSLYEGFGLPVIEAMACGTPVIASASTSLPEVAGGAALLCSPGDSRELAAAMKRVLGDSDLRRQLVEKGLARAATFTLEAQGAAITALYESVLEVPR